jgi:hypothetical protein
MTIEEIERLRQNLDDPLYLDSAVKSIAKGLTEGRVVLEIGRKKKRKIELKFCPCCKLVKYIDEFYISKKGRIQGYCKECTKMKSKISTLRIRRKQNEKIR